MILAREKYDYQSWEAPSQQPRKPANRQAAKKQSSKARRVYLVVVAMAFLLGILIAAQYTRLAVAGYQLDKQEKQLALLEKENQNLAMQVNQLKSLNRIEQIATGKLGMVTTTDVQFLPVPSPAEEKPVVTGQAGSQPRDNSIQGIVKVLASIF
ncbi:MAG TPA: cell division protein FtsL [Bacillota bacterium]|nr:cell division protein FtsL [Bacillota bacterium]